MRTASESAGASRPSPNRDFLQVSTHWARHRIVDGVPAAALEVFRLAKDADHVPEDAGGLIVTGRERLPMLATRGQCVQRQGIPGRGHRGRTGRPPDALTGAARSLDGRSGGPTGRAVARLPQPVVRSTATTARHRYCAATPPGRRGSRRAPPSS